MVRQVVTWLAGFAALAVFVVFACTVLTPALQKWAEPETMTLEILTVTWSDGGEGLNKLLQEGWRVTAVRYDSCMNITVDLER